MSAYAWSSMWRREGHHGCGVLTVLWGRSYNPSSQRHRAEE